jgi:hypothetical protein
MMTKAKTRARFSRVFCRRPNARPGSLTAMRANTMVREILPCGLRQHVRLQFSLLQSAAKTRQECLDFHERQAEHTHASDITHGLIRPLVIDFLAVFLEDNGSHLHLFTTSQRSHKKNREQKVYERDGLYRGQFDCSARTCLGPTITWLLKNRLVI